MALNWKQRFQNVVKAVSESHNTEQGRDATPPILRAELQIPPSVIERYQADQRENAIRDQERSRVDRKRFRVEFATLVFAILGFVVLGWTLVVTRQQAATVQRAFILSERPWVSVQASINSPLTFNDTGAHITLRFQLENTGHSPATTVWIDARMIPQFQQPRDLIAARDKLCEDMRQRSVNPRSIGYVLFPSAQAQQDFSLLLPSEQIRQATVLLPVVFVCTYYRFTFAEEPHHTGAIYTLTRYDPEHPTLSFDIDPHGGSVPVANLRLDALPFGGDSAN